MKKDEDDNDRKKELNQVKQRWRAGNDEEKKKEEA